jgi:uncharacterized membrane protein (UPF0127 family)
VASGRNLIILLCLAVTAGILVLSHGCGGSGPSAPGTESVEIGGEKFSLEVADDEAKRERGLMGRTEIPDHGGMLFVFPDQKVALQRFWMKNCPIDMDIIYLDRQGFVTAKHRMKAMIRLPDESDADYETRCREDDYSSNLPAQFAIELKAGTLERLKVKVEDQIKLDLARLKAAAR